MQRTPNIVRSLLLVCICIIALGTAYSKMLQVKGSTSKLKDEVEESGFKNRIVTRTIEEYDRWHVNGTLRETETDATAILLQYWKLGNIPVSDKNVQNSSWQYRHPWSAVFISHVMLQAGAGNNFPYSNNHAKYIVWARDNALAQQDPLFAAYDIYHQMSAWPEPGDLICMNRRSNQFTLQSINQKCISHCDIIVETNKEKGYIVTIGGNVGQTVNKRKVWLNAEGYIDVTKNWQVLDEEENNPEGSQKEIFAIIKVNNQYK